MEPNGLDKFDAYNISLDFLERYEVVSSAAIGFIKDDAHTRRIVVGEKGDGKSLLLRKKHSAILNRKGAKEKMRLFSPSIGPSSPSEVRLKLDRGKLSDDLLKAASWMRYWEAMLLLCALANLMENRDDIGELRDLASHAFNLEYLHLQEMKNINSIFLHLMEQFQSDVPFPPARFERFCKKATSALVEAVDKRVLYIFCDAIDEGLANWTRSSSDIDRIDDAVNTQMPWVKSQAGLLGAQVLLMRQDPRLRDRVICFCTVRPEAIQHARPLLPDNFNTRQLLDYCVNLVYSNNDLLRIVRTAFNDSAVTDTLRANWRCIAVNETLAQIIVRHSFRHPRDVLFISDEVIKALSDSCVGQDLGAIVNHAAREMVADHLKFMIPPWRDSFFEPLIEKSGKSFIMSEELDALPKGYALRLIREGFLGKVQEENQELVIRFDRFSPFKDSDDSLDPSPVYLMHPAIIEIVLSKRAHRRPDFSSTRFVIGHLNSFPGVKAITSKNRVLVVGGASAVLECSLLTNEGSVVKPRTDGEAGLVALIAITALLRSPASMEPVCSFSMRDMIEVCSILCHHKLLAATFDFGHVGTYADVRKIANPLGQIEALLERAASAPPSQRAQIMAQIAHAAGTASNREFGKQMKEVTARLQSEFPGIEFDRPSIFLRWRYMNDFSDWHLWKAVKAMFRRIGVTLGFERRGPKTLASESMDERFVLIGLERDQIDVKVARIREPHVFEHRHRIN